MFRRRYWIYLCLFLLSLALGPGTAFAAEGGLDYDPDEVTLTGSLGGGALASSLRLLPGTTLGGVKLLPTALVDVTGDTVLRDPIPASAVSLQPASESVTLTAGSLTQVFVQVTPPAVAGTYKGALIVHWSNPAPGQIEIPLTVVARTRPALAFQERDQLAVNGARGAAITQHITLRETGGGSPMTGIRALPQDLHTNGGGTLTASHVRVILPRDHIAGGGVLTATVILNLKGVAAGTYTGNILFTSDTREVVALPVTVNARHRAALPLVVLVLGVVLGVYLLTYQQRGKPRDELILHIARIRETLKQDADLAKYFGPRIEALLDTEVVFALNRELWEEGREAIARIETLIHKWLINRAQWLAQLTRVQDLRDKTQEHPAAHTLTMQRLQYWVDALLAEAVDYGSPSDLAQKVNKVEEKFYLFQALYKKLEGIGQVRAESWPPVSEETKASWTQDQLELQERLFDLTLEDEDKDWNDLEEKIPELAERVADDIAQAEKEAEHLEVQRPKSPGVRGAIHALTAPLRKPLHTSEALRTGEVNATAQGAAEDAKTRQAWYMWVTYAVGGLLLALVGFNTLYVSRPTFGAQLIPDYLSLLLWGLGAQATVTDVARVLQKWDLPFGQSAQ